MILVLTFPNLPAQAVQEGLAVTTPVLVHRNGRIVAPRPYIGMRLERAQALVPHATIHLRHPALEKALWDRLVEELWSFTPWIDAAEAGILRCRGLSSTAVVPWVQQRQACMGVARRSPISYLASLTADVGHMVIVADDDVSLFLDRLSIRILSDLPSVQFQNAFYERLELLGLGTIGRLRNLTDQQLRVQFGPAGTALFTVLSDLKQDKPIHLYTPPEDLRALVRIEDGTREPSVVASAIDEGVEQLYALLQGRLVGRVELYMYDNTDVPVAYKSRMLAAPTAERRRIHTQLHAMLREGMVSTHRIWAVCTRLASISVPKPEQQVLFQPTPDIDMIRAPLSQRFPKAVCRIDVLDPNAYLPERFAHVRPL